MRRRAFLRCLAVLPLVPFLHALAPKSLAGSCGRRTGHMAIAYSTGPAKWIQAHGIIYPNGERRLIEITTGRFTT